MTRPKSSTRVPKSRQDLGLGDGFTMIIGPNQSAIFLEIGYVDGDHVDVIVHAMRARRGVF